jgi:hypothetical protein
MCNDYGNRIPYDAYLKAFNQLKIRLFAPGGAPNLEPRDDIWPTDIAPIIRAGEGGAELVLSSRDRVANLETCVTRWHLNPGSNTSPGAELPRGSSQPTQLFQHAGVNPDQRMTAMKLKLSSARAGLQR